MASIIRKHTAELDAAQAAISRSQAVIAYMRNNLCALDELSRVCRVGNQIRLQASGNLMLRGGTGNKRPLTHAFAQRFSRNPRAQKPNGEDIRLLFVGRLPALLTRSVEQNA